MRDAVYRICAQSSDIVRDITHLFYTNQVEVLDERYFSGDVMEQLYDAFKGIEGTNIAFASTLKATTEMTESQGYGQIYFTFPRAVQERVIASESARNTMHFSYGINGNCGFLALVEVAEQFRMRDMLNMSR